MERSEWAPPGSEYWKAPENNVSDLDKARLEKSEKEVRQGTSTTLAQDMEKNPELAGSVARHPAGSKLTPAPKISGGPGPVRNATRRIRP